MKVDESLLISTELPLENPSNFRFERYWWFCLNPLFMFSRTGNPFWYFYRATSLSNLENPGRLPVQDVRRYWWMWLIDFWNLDHVFGVKESFSTELPFLGDLESRSLPVQPSEVLVIVSCFLKFLHFYVFEVRESFSDIPTDYHVWRTFQVSGWGFRVTQTFVPTKML